MTSAIGLTSTIPVEIIYAAGLTPVDLNNLFIASEKSESMVKEAEAAGFSHNICAWIKGIYSAVLDNNIKQVIAVMGGDCSNTIALAEILARKGVNIISFEYPLSKNRDFLASQMDRLRLALSTTWDRIEETRQHLNRIRMKLNEFDRLTFEENVVTGLENHLFLVGSSDFNSDPVKFEKDLDNIIREAVKRPPRKEEIRLGYLGVPPVFTNFYEFIESMGGRVVFNEVQRQFSMPYFCKDIVDQYLRYTYPYDIGGRIEDIKNAVKERRLDGLIHYTQTFCFRQLYDMIIRKESPVPVLTLEGDRPGKIDSRIALRIETFIEMLKDRI
ncbi:MAG: 2-hydroxyacyl-CoA dehydratase [Deltaproteobacteria bacterium]|nr:2-hydroxyacyl-CoA dehydratase [Deltaproteobacteria bacterium]